MPSWGSSQRMHAHAPNIRLRLEVLLALVLLVAGCLGAQALWSAKYGRYTEEASGYFHSSVYARLEGNDAGGFPNYSFDFDGKSEPHWRWFYSTNLVYRSLHFKWFSFDSNADLVEDSGMLRLPSLAYESSRGTGILTRAVLSEWLLRTTNRTSEATQSVDGVLDFLQAAGRGSLPAPRHHTYYFERPVGGHIQHFLLGYGVGSFVYIWVGVWLLLVVFVARKFWRKRGA